MQLGRQVVFKVFSKVKMMKKYYPEACFLKEIFQGIQISYLETDSLQPMVGKRSKTESKLRWPEFWIQKCKIYDTRRPSRDICKAFFWGKIFRWTQWKHYVTPETTSSFGDGGFLQIKIHFLMFFSVFSSFWPLKPKYMV